MESSLFGYRVAPNKERNRAFLARLLKIPAPPGSGGAAACYRLFRLWLLWFWLL